MLILTFRYQESNIFKTTIKVFDFKEHTLGFDGGIQGCLTTCCPAVKC